MKLKNAFIAVFVGLISVVSLYALPEKTNEQEFTRDGERIRQVVTLRDYNGDGRYDWFRLEVYHWDKDKKKWYRSGGTWGSIPKIKAGNQNTNDDQARFCDEIYLKNSIKAVPADKYVLNEDTSYYADINNSSSIMLIDLHSQDAAPFAILNYESDSCYTLEQLDFDAESYTIPISQELSIIAKYYFPDDNTDYKEGDFDFKINQVVTGPTLNIDLGLLRARILKKFDLYDIQNNLVASINVANNQHLSMDVSQCQSGNYFLKYSDINDLELETVNIVISR